MELRPLIRISKTTSRQVIGRMLSYEVPFEYFYVLDKPSCESAECPLYREYLAVSQSISLERKKDIPDLSFIRSQIYRLEDIKGQCAASGCSNIRLVKRYNNDEKKYHLYHKKYANRRMPKSAIRLYLLLFSIPQEMLGDTHFIRNISLHSLAETLEVAPATIRFALDLLKSFDYITYSHACDKNHFNIIINDYDNMHLSAKEGGSGYFTITSDMMREILGITNVNALRLQLLSILKLDDTVRIRDEYTDEFSVRDLKNILPSHMNYKNNYINVLSNQPSLFNYDIIDGKYVYAMKHNYSLRYNVLQFEHDRMNLIAETLQSDSIVLSADQALQVSRLTVEYTDSVIIQAVHIIHNDYLCKNKAVSSYGALLRHLCQSLFLSSAC